MPSLNIFGWIFMLLAWTFIIGLNIYCFSHIFHEKKAKITGTLEVEAEMDKIKK